MTVTDHSVIAAAIEAALIRGNEGAYVPCSRYGSTTEDCAVVAAAVSVILAGETGEDVDPESVMSLVVNDHSDPAYLLMQYGAEYGFTAEDYIDPEDFPEAGDDPR